MELSAPLNRSSTTTSVGQRRYHGYIVDLLEAITKKTGFTFSIEVNRESKRLKWDHAEWIILLIVKKNNELPNELWNFVILYYIIKVTMVGELQMENGMVW